MCTVLQYVFVVCVVATAYWLGFDGRVTATILEGGKNHVDLEVTQLRSLDVTRKNQDECYSVIAHVAISSIWYSFSFASFFLLVEQSR